MNEPWTPEIVEQKIAIAAQQSQCDAEALRFVIQVMTRLQRHVAAREFCAYLHDAALSQFGGRTREQLAAWGITSSDAIGRVVYALIHVGLLANQPGETPDDFHNTLDFETAFREYLVKRPTQTAQFRLSTLFAVTTLAAIAMAGVHRWGIQGAFISLGLFWIWLIGAYCLYFIVRQRTRIAWLDLVVSAVYVVLGAFGILYLILAD